MEKKEIEITGKKIKKRKMLSDVNKKERVSLK